VIGARDAGFGQALKGTTLTTDFGIADGFLVRGEWRRDFSNQPFFLTSAPLSRNHHGAVTR
jgi:hypothetical protein